MSVKLRQNGQKKKNTKKEGERRKKRQKRITLGERRRGEEVKKIVFST